ncbi:TATA-box-binding protein [Euryarchaeota archaeon ex4484_162]|nr:MAG: TATA-box-binding protein [Thermoplasmata archaeon]OYT58436.1 MAG: TATA-box-binding protein [Euryarchaeota archaeon ex4484_162]RLF62745.1 MAG: TATA-box-binding protein [Thermoplasmata archaeon]
MLKINVQNIVASSTLAKKLDLDIIAKSLENIEYEPEQFPGLVYRLKKPRTAVLLFRSGKANCTGAKSIEEVEETFDIVLNELKNIGVEVVEKPEVVIQNIVAISDLGVEFNLNEVAVGLGLDRVEYEPEQFPGLVYKFSDPPVAFLIFGSGKIVCAGAKKIEDLNKAVDKLIAELSSLGLLY